MHDDGRFERRKCEQEQECRDKLRPDKKRQAHPGHALGPELDDRGDEIDRAEKRRSNEQDEPDEPERLAVENGIVSRAFVCDDREWRVGSPSAFGCAARHEETYEHDAAADKESLVARHVDFRKGHVRRADLQRHDEISKRGEGDRHDAEKDHDCAVHRA